MVAAVVAMDDERETFHVNQLARSHNLCVFLNFVIAGLEYIYNKRRCLHE